MRRSRREKRTDWRLGGRTVLRWNERLLAIALVGLGLGIVAGFALQFFLGGSGDSVLPSVLATIALWLGMAVPIVLALRRSVPIGLLRFRAIDLLWGVALGLAVRGLQGVVSGSAVPSYPTADGQLSSAWLLTDLVGPVVIAPVVEEFFFRVVVLVAIYSLLRRALGGLAAGIIALLASTGLFVLAHAAGGVADVSAVGALFALGATCGLLVLLTGRIWSAVLAHLVFNGAYVVLALIGTFWG